MVAYLDPDDVWAPSHFRTAIEQLKEGAAFYFDDNIHEKYSWLFEH